MQILNLCLYVYAKKGLPIVFFDRCPVTFAVDVRLSQPMPASMKIVQLAHKRYARMHQDSCKALMTKHCTQVVRADMHTLGPFRVFFILFSCRSTIEVARTYMKERLLYSKKGGVNCFLLCDMA